MNFSTSTVVFAWKPAAWLRVTGDDAATFLQGQFTNELRGLAVGAAVYGLWLTLKGKVLADSFVVRGAVENEFWVGSYHSPATVIRERLESFIIADDVVVEDVTGEWSAFSLIGPGVNAALTASAAERCEGVLFRGRRTREETVEWVVPLAQAEAAHERLKGLTVWSEAEVEARRIAEAIPAVPADIGPSDLPGEGALEGETISYTKGCYLGQEVMARLKSMGQVRRRLLRVAGDGEAPAMLPAELFIGPRKVGEVRSVARQPGGGWTGLAMLSLLQVTAGATLAFKADGPAEVRLIDTP
jgi:folate-binding protein YgfZ